MNLMAGSNALAECLAYNKYNNNFDQILKKKNTHFFYV